MTDVRPDLDLPPVTAPVSVYSRGYDGASVETPAHSFSSPFLPESNPVVYPTPAAYRDRP